MDFSIPGRIARAVTQFVEGDLEGDVSGLLEMVEQCFPHWTMDMEGDLQSMMKG
jgi:hypothetical protein